MIGKRIGRITLLGLIALLPAAGSCGLYGVVPYNRGNSLLEEGKYDAAIVEFNKALESNPKSALTYYHRGLAYTHKEMYDQAVSDYTNALALNTGVLEKRSLLDLAYYHRGVSYHATGKLDPAIRDYTKAIEINPDLAEAYAKRGKARLDRRENRLALVDLNKASELKPALADQIKPWLTRAKAK